MLACADIEEGVVLRRGGGARADSGLRRAQRQRPRRPVRVRADARRSRRQAPRAPCRRPRPGGGPRFGYHLKIDTGMNRLGFRHDNLRPHAAGPAVEPEPPARRGLHALCLRRRAREPASSATSASASSARGHGCACSAGRAGTGTPAMRGAGRAHAANSAALLRDSRVWYDAVRPGLLLYGIVPPPLASTIRSGR